MKFSQLVFALFLVAQVSGQTSKIRISEAIGYDPEDSTAFLQFAFEDTEVDTVIIDNVGSDWNTGPLFVRRDNLTILFESGVTLQALSGVFDRNESLIRITDRNNINIVGYGATRGIREFSRR